MCPGKRLGLQTRRGPGPGLEKAVRLQREVARPTRAVVHACLSLYPQLHGLRPEVVSAPMRRPRYDDVDLALCPGEPRQRRAEALRGHRERLEQGLARFHGLALRARPGAHATRPWPGGKV